MTHTQEEKTLVNRNCPRGTQISDLLDKDFKYNSSNFFIELKEIMCKQLEETMRMTSHQIENTYKGKEIIFKEMSKIHKWTNIITQKKNVLVRCQEG